ncbi:hypothetical protein RUND412_003341 [Rhizina undulata]
MSGSARGRGSRGKRGSGSGSNRRASQERITNYTLDPEEIRRYVPSSVAERLREAKSKRADARFELNQARTAARTARNNYE